MKNMTAAPKKLLVWGDEREAALAAWMERGAELGLDLRGYDGKPSASAYIGAALRRATACRCEELIQQCNELDECGATNPLRKMREEAGLSQAEAAARCSMSRGAWANAEKAAKATPAMVERARAGLR